MILAICVFAILLFVFLLFLMQYCKLFTSHSNSTAKANTYYRLRDANDSIRAKLVEATDRKLRFTGVVHRDEESFNKRYGRATNSREVIAETSQEQHSDTMQVSDNSSIASF